MMQTQFQGYYRYPTIHGEQVVFVAEDDLWQAPAAGGVARRLTANLGEVTHPFFSPDGEWLAFIGREEGHSEVYLMPAGGGPARRLTFLGGNASVVGWRGERIVFASDTGQAFRNNLWLYTIDPQGQGLEKLPYGLARRISWGAQGVAIGRNTGDPARWKRYRGGTAGEIWIDENSAGEFRKLLFLAGNLADPIWIGERIYFLSDHEGVGNLYSCTPAGQDLQQHTHHGLFYARNATGDGQRIVYHAGADLYVFDAVRGESRKIEIVYPSPQVQRSRKFTDPAGYLQDYALSANGARLALISRGQAFTLGNWEGPVLRHGPRPNGRDGDARAVRYRLACWLKDGKRLVLASDDGGEDHLEIHTLDGSAAPRLVTSQDLGRPLSLALSPVKDEIALTNHRNELFRVDLESAEATLVEKSLYGPIAGYDWSPDGRWIAYSFPPNPRQRVIKVYDTQTGEIHTVSDPVLNDYSPAFDPEGKYLYFLSARTFNPVYDNLHFDLNFPKGVRPYAVTLRKDLPSPFVPEPRGFDEKDEAPPKKDEQQPPAGGEGKDPAPQDAAGQDESPDEPSGDTPGETPSEMPGATQEDAKEETKEETKKEGEAQKEPPKVHIDFEGIADRIVPFPVEEGLYGELAAIKGRVFYTLYPVEGARGRRWAEAEPPARARLNVYDLGKLEEAEFVHRLSSFTLSADGSSLAVRVGNRLRVIQARRDPSQPLSNGEPGRKSGWVDLGRLRVSIEPLAEWRQMFYEAWRLQRDHFWVEDMSGVEWVKIRDRYAPLVARVASRSEFSDLMWELQGELSTSHCYEMGGDYRPRPGYHLGFLGADLEYDPQQDVYRFTRVLKGDVWDEDAASPLRRPGVNVREGMLLLAVGGQPVNAGQHPNELLVHTAGQEVQLTVAESDGSGRRTVCVKAAGNEGAIRYRDWVEANRRWVHEKSGGKVGYVHVPNMGADGYAEFHRYFLAELDYPGLIVDVRYNGGGHVSPLLLEKLARQRLGYDLSRWMSYTPYPPDSARGAIVALTNEDAGSDGDIFSHAFKMMKLGKLIGRRTWGGVIGIWPRNWLVDGTITTQPEFSFWFKDVGWNVENYGTDPDIEVEITPQDWVRGADPQLERSLQEALEAIAANPPLEPDFTNRPRRGLPVEA